MWTNITKGVKFTNYPKLDGSQTFGGQNSGNKNVGIFAQLAADPAPKDSEQPF